MIDELITILQIITTYRNLFPCDETKEAHQQAMCEVRDYLLEER